MPALLAEELAVDGAVSTYERSVALEELWTPPKSGALLLPVLEKRLAPELADFLRNEQTGTRAVTRKMMDRVLQARAGAFGAPSVAVNPSRIGDHDRLGPVFGDLPDDDGHWGLNYFEHTLDPLRRVPPGYVLEIASGDFDEDRLAAGMPDNVAGIVVVEVPNSESE